jgi:hypothetical protein
MLTTDAATPDERLSDVLSLCAKILHTHDVAGVVYACDLVEMRGHVDVLLKTSVVARSPRLKRDDEDRR